MSVPSVAGGVSILILWYELPGKQAYQCPCKVSDTLEDAPASQRVDSVANMVNRGSVCHP